MKHEQINAANPAEINVNQLITEPMFLHWCQCVFWAFLKDQKDLEREIKNLLNIGHLNELKSNKHALKTFEFYLGRPYLVWFNKRAAGAHSVYQVPIDYLEEDQKKNIQSANMDIQEHLGMNPAKQHH